MLHRTQRRRALAGTAAIVALAMAAIPTVASARKVSATSSGCSLPSTSQVFSSFGDLNQYYLASGGSFEGALTWAKSGDAAAVLGNEPYYLAGADHKSSVRLRSGGSLTSAKFCVSADLPHLRFLAKSAGSGQLDVRVDTYAGDGTVTGSSSGSISPSDHASWAPTRFVSLNTSSIPAGQTAYASLTISSQGDWHVDDVFVDPRMR